ncbi:MAG: hypothetical protein E4G95_01050 [Bacteroidia bacterium]|nr:MAG: hypothetical protein E4G95_01050 [Bacteroidia bacterium]
MTVMRILQIIILAFFIPFTISGQNDEMRGIFVKAESHYLFGEFELANPLYLILNDQMPGNANIKYKIGNCYLNIPGEKIKATEFLEEAVKNASYEANAESFKETRAPLDAYFSLATAYRINDEFEKALETYTRLKTLMPESGKLENSDFINQQINSCVDALSMIDVPVVFTSEDLGSLINVGSVNSCPVISGDGNTLVFTEERGLENSIFFVRKLGGAWQEPVDITEQLGGAKDCSSSSLNYNGTRLYLYKNDGYNGNIYCSDFSDEKWSKIKKLNKNINTKFYESHASISTDGKTLYFTSNREGGEGGLDIYVSVLDSKGKWGKAKNLGIVINTPFNEDTPFITGDFTTLYFSSEGHAGMGGYDLFRAEKQGESWKSPSNLGYPLSTSDNDSFFHPFNNGQNGYYSVYTGYKEKNIQYITMGASADQGGMTEIKGIVTLSDTIIEFNDNFRVLLADRNTGYTLDVSFPNKSTGFYHLLADPGQYVLTWEGLGYISIIKEIEIYENHPSPFETLDVTLEPDPDWAPENIEKIDYSNVPMVDEVNSSILVTDLVLRDVRDSDSTNKDVLYYTVQLMALHNPVDLSFFRHAEVTVMYNDADQFYKYTTGKYMTKEEAYNRRDELISLGYPDDLFIQTVFRENK